MQAAGLSLLAAPAVMVGTLIGLSSRAGLLAYPVLKTITGRGREVPLPLWLLAAMSLMFFLVYPHK